MKKPNMFRLLLSDQSGATMVEAAIALPCFILFFFTTLQVAILVTAYIAATEAVSVVGRETAAIGGGMVVPYSCAAHAQTRMQEELNRFVVPAQIIDLHFPAVVSDTGVSGYELQTTIRITCPLCIRGTGLDQSLSTINLRHFIPAENISSCS